MNYAPIGAVPGSTTPVSTVETFRKHLRHQDAIVAAATPNSPIEAFKGNTPVPKTVGSQIVKLQQCFHAAHIILVGNRGMRRGP